MWTYSHTETARTTPQALWRRWSEVGSWPEQDTTLESASINGSFAVGRVITLKPKKSPKVKVTLAEMTLLKSFSSIGKLPLAKLRFDHLAKAGENEVTFTQSVTISGPLSGLYGVLMGHKMSGNLKARMSKLVELLEIN